MIELVEIPVEPRKRPVDYQIADTDDEVYSFKRLENLLENKATKAQVANLVANVGSDAEMVDVRYGADGRTYPSAGEAVRQQVDEVKDRGVTFEASVKAAVGEVFVPVSDPVVAGMLCVQTADGYPVTFAENAMFSYISTKVFPGETVRLTFNDAGYLYFVVWTDNNDICVGRDHYRVQSDPDVSWTDMELVVPAGARRLYLNSYNAVIPVIKRSTVQNVSDIIDTKVADRVPNAKNAYVCCIGDSLTDGSGSTASRGYPYTLQQLLGSSFEVRNRGIGGEGSVKIASRMGALPMFLEPCTLKSSGTTTGLKVKNWLGGAEAKLLWRGGRLNESEYSLDRFGINPVIIGGVEGNLKQYASDTSGEYRFERLTNGEKVVINRPTEIITKAQRDDTSGISVIWVGTNDTGWTVEEIANHIDYLVDMAMTDRYIVIGLTSKAYHADIVEKNAYLKKRFGRHFLDVRDYILSYGLADAGITPTAADTAALAEGEIPPSLLADDVHFRDAGYEIIGSCVYKKGVALGYWS